MENYNVHNVLHDLDKLGCKIDPNLKMIDVWKAVENNRMGNKTWGKIDFLVNSKHRNGYHLKGIKLNKR